VELATTEDLQRATAQGTIVEITVDGVTYGSGGIRTPPGFLSVESLSLSLGIGIFFGLLVFFFYLQLQPKHRRQRALPDHLQQSLYPDKSIDLSHVNTPSSEDDSGGCKATEDRLADLWVLFSPNTDIEETLTFESKEGG